jgi:hypothetical protein
MGMYVPPQYGQGGGNSQNLVQLAMAVKSFKMQEKEKKQQEASQRVSMLMQNPQLLLMQDPKEMEKDLKTLGIKITDKQPANPQDAAKTAPPTQNPGTGDTPATNVNPSNLATVNKSGAQSASPASSNAAGKAPGGGVTGDPMQHVDTMAAKASERLKQNYGALAPIYMGAQSQVEASRHQAQLQAEIDTLKDQAAGGDIRAAARLASLAGHEVTDSMIRNMVIGANMNPEAVQQALDVALHNESGNDKATRFASMSKDLLANKGIMDKLENPLDAYKITSSIVYGGAIPEVVMKPHTLDELKSEADYEHQLADDYGTPFPINHLISRGRTMGLSLSQMLPDKMMGIFSKNLPGQKADALSKQASAAMLSAQAEKEKADNEHSKIKRTLDQTEYKQLNDRIALMIDADKVKKPWPDEIRQGYLDQLARATGLMPEDVDHWYKWSTSHEYKQDPDSDLAKAAAGRGPAGKKPKKEPTLAERGGIAGEISRRLPRNKEGKIETDPSKLYMDMDEATRGRALKYLRDILVGIEPEPQKPEGPGA